MSNISMKTVEHYFLWEELVYFPQLISQQILPRIQNNTNLLWEGIPTWKYRAVVATGGQRDLDPAFLETQMNGLFQGVKKRGWYVQG